MNSQSHFSKADLLHVLTDHDSGELEQQIESHLIECDSCRKELESLAANPEWWTKASTLLAEDPVGETIAFSSRQQRFDENDDDSDMTEAGSAEGYSIVGLLDPPSHPEMLGRLGHYEMEREIGRGGMGVVLKAYDTELNRSVAVKVLAPHLACNGTARQRFAREARSAAAILHPNVIAIHGVSPPESKTPWLVMPYIVGPSLEQIVQQEGALDEKDLVCFAMQIAAGLAAAHSQGVIHRDIKPANVLIENGMGRVVITDFGLARAESDASMTQTGWFAGTPNFMSPEQSRGIELDHRSDLFSLGSVMYYMATGRLPFRAEQSMAVLERIRNERPTPARQVNSSISTTISNLIETLLAKDPDSRIQTAAEIHQVLEQTLAHLHHPDARRMPVVESPIESPIEKSKPGSHGDSKSIGGPLALAFCMLVAIAGFLIVKFWKFDGEAPLKRTPTTAARPFETIVADYDLQRPEEFHSEVVDVGQEIEALLEPAGLNPDRRMNFFEDDLSVEIRRLESEIESSFRQLNQ